jgi:hypothetical protein
MLLCTGQKGTRFTRADLRRGRIGTHLDQFRLRITSLICPSQKDAPTQVCPLQKDMPTQDRMRMVDGSLSAGTRERPVCVGRCGVTGGDPPKAVDASRPAAGRWTGSMSRTPSGKAIPPRPTHPGS